MESEPWATVSVCVTSQTVSVDEIARLLGQDSSDKSRRIWSAEVVADTSTPLSDQLTVAKEFLRARLPALRELRGRGEINVSVGWTPRSPQDGIILDREMIAMLASVDAYVLLDTYGD